MFASMVRSVRALALMAALPLCGASASTVLTLSDLSSDETSADLLDARLLFDVGGSELTFTATNDTPLGAGYDINAIFFNGSANVEGLSLIAPVAGWTLVFDERADGFGTFDFALINDRGNDTGEILPGESLTFSLAIAGSGPFEDADFTTNLSSIPPGNNPSISAAKFVSGPGGDSAFGAVVPEPGTAVLVLCGLGAVSQLRRRHRLHVRRG